MLDIRIRQPERVDHAPLLALHRELYIRYSDAILAPEIKRLIAYRCFDEVLEEDINALLRAPNTRILLAEYEEKVVGYISGRIVDDARRLLRRKGLIEDWFVSEAQRGKGIGTQLLEAIEQWFRAQGCQLMESTTWAANEPGLNAHRKLGFNEVQMMLRKELK